MRQEDRELLLLDLCGRLPYWVKGALCDTDIWTLDRIWTKKGYESVVLAGDYHDIEDFKPYLFPLSSMTKEQKEEIEDKLIFPSNSNGGWIEILYNDIYNIPFWFVDFCNKNHFDYRGLIEKGLAIDARGLNIY